MVGVYRRWMCCVKCRKVTSYIVDTLNDQTTISRGEYLAHNRYIITGFKSEADAQAWLDKHPIEVKAE